MQKFFPDLYQKIDFSKEVRFLDKEMQKLFADWEKKGYRRGDLLLEYHLKKGKKQYVLVHVEAQHGYDKELSERMFISFYRIHDKYPKIPLTALAIYTGDKIPSVFNRFEYEFEGVKLVYEFPTFIVKQQDESALIKSENPFDLAILAGLYALNTKGNENQAFRFKMKVARLCFERNYSKKQIKELIIFVSFLIALSEDRQLEYQSKIINMIEEKNLPLAELYPNEAGEAFILLFGKTFEKFKEETESDIRKELEVKLEKDIKTKVREELEVKLEKDIKAKVKKELEMKMKKDSQARILKMHKAKLAPEKIATFLDLDLNYVKKIIQQFDSKA